jgi:hypothetical protein
MLNIQARLAWLANSFPTVQQGVEDDFQVNDDDNEG